MDRRNKAAVIVLLVAALTLLAITGGCGESGQSNGSSTVATSPAEPLPDDSSPDGQATVDVFFIKGETAFRASRTVGKAGPEAALRELLKGPNEEEASQGIVTAIPQGTRLLSYSASDEKALADFSGELSSYGGGSAIVQAIIKQIEETITSNGPSIRSVEITVEGASADEALQP